MNENKILSEETAKLLDQYFDAAANLYGIIPLRTLLRIYNSQNEPISEEAFVQFADSIYLDAKYYDIFSTDEILSDTPESEIKTMSKNLVAEYICLEDDFEEYFEIIELQSGKSYYIPDKKQLLKYADDCYFEKTLEFIGLRAFLRNQNNLTKKKADDMADDIQLAIALEKGNISYAINEAARLGLDLNNPNIRKEFSILCDDLCQHTRMHIHCGHTPAEIY